VLHESKFIQVASQVLMVESEAIGQAASRLGNSFLRGIKLALNSPGRLVTIGVGKSGHIARKIAATLASTGSPALFVHAAEAAHGDLGMITTNDVAIVVSQSGESEEIVSVCKALASLNVPIIAITSNPDSELGRSSAAWLDSTVAKEACPMGIAPTASTSVQLALGDAFAMALMTAKGFKREDFARRHPGGTLGRKYALKVADVMQPINMIPHCTESTPLIDAIGEISRTRAGAVIITRDNHGLAGIFTDSDMRRLVTKKREGFTAALFSPVKEFMTRSPRTVEVAMLASATVSIFESQHISRLVCLKGSEPVGLLSIHDLIQHKIH
jgi:arabinose-5-phosphate isomerase